MQIGLQLPQWGEAASRDGVLAVARAAEAAGFDSVWASDHVVHALGSERGYPYSADGSLPYRAQEGYLEALTTLAVVAGATERVRIGTSVLVLPMRNLLLTAKSLASLDVLSGGRLSVALAPGWWREEFEALGADFEHRGALLDAQLDALVELWTEGRGSAEGELLHFPAVVCEPRPLQPGGPPLWIGGEGPRVWRRVARIPGAGWHGIGYRPERVAAARAGLAAACARSGRDLASVGLSTSTGLPGTSERIAARVGELRELGLAQVVFIPRGDLAETLAAVSAFASARASLEL